MSDSPDPSLVDQDVTFTSFNLDPRLQRAIARLDYSNPTLVQAKAIPLALEGKDILARAKTGSGKTVAYLIPIIQGVLARKTANPTEKGTQALILVPTRELAEQVTKSIEQLTLYSAKVCRCVNVATPLSEAVQKPLLASLPEIVVSTPSRALAHINSGSLSLRPSLTYLVIDEADLLMEYGHEEDLKAVVKGCPKGVQTFLMSATLTKEVESIKNWGMRKPAILRLEEGDADSESQLLQYQVKCGEEEKFLLVYVIFKLRLVKGKTIVFVNDIDRGYRVKLFLEQFGIRSCVLNAELPVNSRLHIVEEFNKDVYDIIIATDEADLNVHAGDSSDDEAAVKHEDNSERPSKKRKRSGAKQDKEYGVSRGVDFQNVSCVLNFDLPTTVSSYIHRIGRTARAGKSGMALSFVVPLDQYGKHKATTCLTAKRDEKVLTRIEKEQEKRGTSIKPYAFDMSQVDAFRYRMEDALRAVTRAAIHTARAKELRQEILTSEKLKRHFEENPQDLQHLRHDLELHPNRVQPHLKHVPEYLMPKAGGEGVMEKRNVGFVGFGKVGENRIRKNRAINRAKGKGKKADPLKTFKGKGKR
ncbi:DEAD-domain-containing protein [Saitoella complicata NRRL Y-17804]|uniref:ATP-dependent RNA helicase DBP9 n=1 Tax=Saitoella complicata (strain BCRC 22490 / CBS 7301 / JCM 7358 / NBRC 10748 / NRRL Y-17804) TaxID=698492 RepID=A0A0E9NND5_SAICN|nr:DEAD-domain-containing protein [Saitoella complicata NRRL Y-17804]ODQ53733.1 DEAD-domain-containing protein [Saitoella complicata NRRL Y-17804]GAO50915.1 hypothetical protein G7K_5034-t1 [Saitoella complicata NRRL Y-17804]